MITFIGVLLLIAAVAAYYVRRINNAKRTANREHGRPEEDDIIFTPKWFNHKLLGVVGILTFFINGLFFYADAGKAYAVQYIDGSDKMIVNQGIKMKWYGRTIPLSYEISIKDIILPKRTEEDDSVKLPENTDGIYNREAQRWEFSDAIKARIATAVVVGVSTEDEEAFLNMADRNRSESKLIYGRVLPNIDAALKNTAKLMDAQEYISGKASDFDRYFRDQLENGMYLVEEYKEVDDTPEIIGDTNTVRTISTPTKDVNKQTKYRIKRDSQGNILRDNKSNTLKQYGIKIYQAQVTGIDWEESFDARLQLQKEQVAQTQLEKQEAEKEYYRAKKEIAKGESNKAAERAKLEKEQIQLTIAAETRAKVAEQDLIAEKKRYEVAKYKKLTEKENADAIYYTNQRLVDAGLTPQEQMERDIRMNKDKWTAISSMRFDGVYMNGEKGGQDGLLSSLLGAQIAKDMKAK